MEALDGQFSEMLLHAKIYQLVILYDSIVIVVISEDVTHHILDFSFRLMHHGLQKFFDLAFLELLVIVRIEFDDFQVDHLSDGEGEFVGLEFEALVFVAFAFDFYELALSRLDLAALNNIH